MLPIGRDGKLDSQGMAVVSVGLMTYSRGKDSIRYLCERVMSPDGRCSVQL
jgi:hypothetical protein